jgi:glycosyltransferase involved in cell wall biosynthesis
MRNFIVSLADALGTRHEVRPIGLDTGVGTRGDLRTNRLLISPTLRRSLGEFGPDAIIYIPLSSSTLGGFVRSWILRRLCPGTPVVMIGLQPRHRGWAARALIRLFSPDAFLAQGEASLADIPPGVPRGVIPSGIDTERFKPVTPAEKAQLRRSLGLDEEGQILLHVGHIRRNRNVKLMSALRNEVPCVPVLVGSTSTERDDDLLEELAAAGVHVVREKVSHIERYYQVADCYLFPVHSDQAAIEMPLSVLEAMAADVPVVTTRFGSLPAHFPAGHGLQYFDRDQDLARIIRDMLREDSPATRERVVPYAWTEIAADLIAKLEKWHVLRKDRDD